MRFFMDMRERLRALRLARGWSQEQLANRLGRPQAWVSRRERGATRWQHEEIAEVAEILGYGAETYLVPPGAQGREIAELLNHVEPDDLPAVADFLAALPLMDDGTRSLILAQLRLAAGRFLDG